MSINEENLLATSISMPLGGDMGGRFTAQMIDDLRRGGRCTCTQMLDGSLLSNGMCDEHYVRVERTHFESLLAKVKKQETEISGLRGVTIENLHTRLKTAHMESIRR